MPAARAQVSRSVTIDQPRDEVWKHVADINGVVSFMTSLESCEQVGDHRYHWKLRSYAALGYRFAPEITLDVVWHPPERVQFSPAGASQDRAEGGGALRLEALSERATSATMQADLTIELPIPRLLIRPASAVLTREFQAGFDRFLERLTNAAG